jgi:PhnB protein
LVFLRKPAPRRGSMTTTTIAPFLSVRRGAAAVAFYKAAFGAVELFKIESPTGDVVAQLSVEGAAFWLSDESPEHGNFSPETLNGSTTRMVLTIEDPDAMFDRAVAAGARVVTPMTDDYGWHLGRVVDPFGHHWEIGKPLDQK